MIKRKPNIPSYKTVPDLWKAPLGPYVQSPVRYGERWYKVNPFTGMTPWVDDPNTPNYQEPVEVVFPEGFVAIFGPEPVSEDFHSEDNPSLAFRLAMRYWNQNLTHFKQAGKPEWLSQGEFELIQSTTVFWGLGVGRIYEGRYGWMMRFPDSGFPRFETHVHSAMIGIHQVISSFQIMSLNQGIVPEKRHPYVPPGEWSSTSSNDAPIS